VPERGIHSAGPSEVQSVLDVPNTFARHSVLRNKFRAPFVLSAREPNSGSFKIVDMGPLAIGLEHLLHKFDVLRMKLIIVLGFFIGKDYVESHLVGLIHHRTVAVTHPAYMKMQNTRDGDQIALRPLHQFRSGLGQMRMGPKDNNM